MGKNRVLLAVDPARRSVIFPLLVKGGPHCSMCKEVLSPCSFKRILNVYYTLMTVSRDTSLYSPQHNHSQRVSEAIKLLLYWGLEKQHKQLKETLLWIGMTILTIQIMFVFTMSLKVNLILVLTRSSVPFDRCLVSPLIDAWCPHWDMLAVSIG